jgi:Hemerythrin HHE cation binding domain
MTSIARASDHDDTLVGYMTGHHEHLNQLYARLLDALAVNAPDVRDLWTELDHELLAHMEAEERFVLPAFARIDRDEAVAILREHGRIRELLLELGIAVDLHYIRFERSREFIETLRAHAAREDRLLYRWADQKLDPSLVEATRRHIAG